MPTDKPEAQFNPPLDQSLFDQAQAITNYHKPDEDGIKAIANVRLAASVFIAAIAQNCPDGPDRSAAIRKAREAMMTANAAIVVPQVSI